MSAELGLKTALDKRQDVAAWISPPLLMHMDLAIQSWFLGSFVREGIWWREAGSNRRPTGYESYRRF
jgi:hypothetical protein